MPGKPDPLTRPVGAVRTIQNIPYRTQGSALSEPGPAGDLLMLFQWTRQDQQTSDSHANAPEILSLHFTESINNIINSSTRRAAVFNSSTRRVAAIHSSTRRATVVISSTRRAAARFSRRVGATQSLGPHAAPAVLEPPRMFLPG